MKGGSRRARLSTSCAAAGEPATPPLTIQGDSIIVSNGRHDSILEVVEKAVLAQVSHEQDEREKQDCAEQAATHANTLFDEGAIGMKSEKGTKFSALVRHIFRSQIRLYSEQVAIWQYASHHQVHVRYMSTS